MAHNWKKNSVIGAGVGVVSWLLGILYNLLFSGGGQAQATVDLGLITQGAKAQIQSGISTDLASKMIGWLNGLLPFDFAGLFMLVVAGVVLVNIGVAGLNMLPVAGLKKTPMIRLISSTVIGSLAISIALAYMAGGALVLPTLNAVASMVIYFFIVAVVYGVIARTKFFGKYMAEA